MLPPIPRDKDWGYGLPNQKGMLSVSLLAEMMRLPSTYTESTIRTCNGCNPTRNVDLKNIGKPPPQKFSHTDPIPAGDVTEGNEESDWAAWEDSVTFQDSLMPDFQGLVTLSKSASAKPIPVPAIVPVSRTGPAVEVVEGNDEIHWAAWEESVLFQDSQLADSLASPKPELDSSSSPVDPGFEPVDIFSAVHSKSA
jgi:hypothetical protein